MKTLSAVAVLVLGLCLAYVPASQACEGCGCSAKHDHDVTGEQLAGLLKGETPPLLLDARSGKYDDGRRIPGAKSLAAGASAEDVAKVIPTKETAVVTYCASVKCPASAKLAKHLKSLGYTNVKEYPAGIAGWAEEGRPIEEPK